jgi:hypothetical protein
MSMSLDYLFKRARGLAILLPILLSPLPSPLLSPLLLTLLSTLLSCLSAVAAPSRARRGKGGSVLVWKGVPSHTPA